MVMEGLRVPSPACALPQTQVSRAKGWAVGKVAGAKHVNARRVQHLRSTAPYAVMDFLKNHLASEDNAYLWQVGAPGPHRRLPAGAAAADRAADVAEAPFEPLSSAGVGACALRVHPQVYLNPYPRS
jgi:hypothetical protein